MPGTLYVVATPIGNMEDVTLRAARVLGEVSLIAAEDTRQTRKLLAHLGLHTRMLSYNEHNAAQRTPRILRVVLEDDVALVSDAGVPIVSDPGAGLVRAAAEQGTVVVPIPGPSAVTAALAAAGMPADAFHFLGFPPRARGARTALITRYEHAPETLILFEAPHRLRATLEDLRVVLGDRPIVVCRELTKLHEELFHGTPSEALDHFKIHLDIERGDNPIDPQHQSFRFITKAKMNHDIEQFRYLASLGPETGHFLALAKVYEAVDTEIEWPNDDEIVIPLSDDHRQRLGDTYNRPIHVLEAHEATGSTLSNTLDVEKITADYFTHAFGMTSFDNLLNPIALASLRHFLLASTIWFDFNKKGGYLGAILKDGMACPLLLQIADDLRQTLPDIFKNHLLTQLWAYKYDSRLTGIEVHADFAAINVNFWITPDTANLNSASGGLVVYDVEAPLDWNFKTYNNDQNRIRTFLADQDSGKIVVPYGENRIVLFNSNLFHETDTFDFKQGYENRRINITMLFGYREH